MSDSASSSSFKNKFDVLETFDIKLSGSFIIDSTSELNKLRNYPNGTQLVKFGKPLNTNYKNEVEILLKEKFRFSSQLLFQEKDSLGFIVEYENKIIPHDRTEITYKSNGLFNFRFDYKVKMVLNSKNLKYFENYHNIKFNLIIFNGVTEIQTEMNECDCNNLYLNDESIFKNFRLHSIYLRKNELILTKLLRCEKLNFEKKAFSPCIVDEIILHEGRKQ